MLLKNHEDNSANRRNATTYRVIERIFFAFISLYCSFIPALKTPIKLSCFWVLGERWAHKCHRPKNTSPSRFPLPSAHFEEERSLMCVPLSSRSHWMAHHGCVARRQFVGRCCCSDSSCSSSSSSSNSNTCVLGPPRSLLLGLRPNLLLQDR